MVRCLQLVLSVGSNVSETLWQLVENKSSRGSAPRRGMESDKAIDTVAIPNKAAYPD